MKYLLIENADDNDPRVVTIFDDPGARAIATRALIVGPPNKENKDLRCPELEELTSNGIVAFHGSPCLEWIDAEVQYHETEEIEVIGKETLRLGGSFRRLVRNLRKASTPSPDK